MMPRGAAIAAALLAATVASGCGGGERQDAGEKDASYPVQVTRAHFPRLQGLGETASFSVAVRNPGTETIPNVAMTVDGFANPDAVPGAADPQRPIWIINAGPIGGKHRLRQHLGARAAEAQADPAVHLVGHVDRAGNAHAELPRRRRPQRERPRGHQGQRGARGHDHGARDPAAAYVDG